MPAPSPIDDALRPVGELAAGYIDDGMRVGLGTGRAASAFVHALALRIRAEGLDVVGVPTSEATRRLAQSLALRLAALDDVGELDLTVDGADEVDPDLDLIKGLGGALVREKIVAASSARLVIVVGAEKIVSRLGVKTPVPVEIVPFARPLCQRLVRTLGADPRLRMMPADPKEPYVTDNGNLILDCHFNGIDHPRALEVALREIPGVVGTGFFLNMAERVLVQDGNTVRVLMAKPSTIGSTLHPVGKGK
ncbi:MAG: ribose-5-phosphate isomerase RpiA [Candidatus Binatia bacterium]